MWLTISCICDQTLANGHCPIYIRSVGWADGFSWTLQFTETEMLSFWWNFNHWLHRKLSFWQLSVQPVIKISSKWRHFCFSVMMIYYHIVYKASLGHNELTSLEDRGKMSWWWWYHAWPCILRGTSPWRPLRGLLSWCSIYLSVRSLRPVDFVKDLPSNLSYKVGASWSALLQLHLHSWLNTWFKWIG